MLTEEARQYRNRLAREWRSKNKDRNKTIQENYLNRKAEQEKQNVQSEESEPAVK